MASLHTLIVRPVVTEKSSAAYQIKKEYAFEVHPEANKHQIREALKQLFGVTAVAVRTIRCSVHGASIQSSGRRTMRRPARRHNGSVSP